MVYKYTKKSHMENTSVGIDVAFSGGNKPICPIWLTIALHLTLRFRLLYNRDKVVIFG